MYVSHSQRAQWLDRSKKREVGMQGLRRAIAVDLKQKRTLGCFVPLFATSPADSLKGLSNRKEWGHGACETGTNYKKKLDDHRKVDGSLFLVGLA